MTPPDALPALEVDAAATTWRRALAGAIVGGLVIAALEFGATRGSVPPTLPDQLAWLARLCVHWTLAALPVGIAVGVLEHRAHGLRPSLPAYAIALSIGAGAGALLLALHGKFVDPSISETAVGFDMALPDRFLYGFWTLGFWGSVGTALHVESLREKRGIAAVRASELARLRSERRLAEARLGALDAQVEPEFVLAMLGTIERLYASDPATADRVLDALIRFLRQAIPLLRRARSTIGDECRLLHACLLTLGAATGAQDVVRIDVDARVEGTPMPPGILLTIARRLHFASPPGAGAARFDVRAGPRAIGPGAELSVTVDAGREPPDLPAFEADLGRRLRMSCGPGATLEVLRDAPPRLTLRISLLDPREVRHEATPAH